jgi:hypothetical protein
MMHGVYHVACYGADGALRWRKTLSNTVTTVGLNALLNATFDAGPYTATVYCGLISGVGFVSAPSVNDRMNDHTGWQEAGATYSPTCSSGRATATFAAASNATATFAGDATFHLSDSGTLRGVFLVFGSGASSVIDNTGGVLLSAALFDGGPMAISASEWIAVTYTLAASAATPPPQPVAPTWVLPSFLSLAATDPGIQLAAYVHNPTNYTLTDFALATGTLPSGAHLDSNGRLWSNGATPGAATDVRFAFDYQAATVVSHPTTGVVTGGSPMLLGVSSHGTGQSGPLSLTVTAIPYNNAVGYCLYASKNLWFVRFEGDARGSSVWYKVGGDHAHLDPGEPSEMDGRGEIFYINLATDQWVQVQPNFLRVGSTNSTMQGALPDDPSCVVRGDEMWVVANQRVSSMTTTEYTNYCRSNYGGNLVPPAVGAIVTQDMENVVAWNYKTGVWRAVVPRMQDLKGDRAWATLYDQLNDRFITPVANSFIVMDKDGNDISGRGGAANLLYDYGAYDFHSAGIVQDGRTAYVFDQAHGKLYRFNLDTWTLDYRWFWPLTMVCDLSSYGCTYAYGGRGIHLCWHAGLRAVIVRHVYGPLYVYQVDTQQLSTFDMSRPVPNGDGFRGMPAFTLYDPVLGDCFSMGGIDFCDPPCTVATWGDSYWRLHFDYA